MAFESREAALTEAARAFSGHVDSIWPESALSQNLCHLISGPKPIIFIYTWRGAKSRRERVVGAYGSPQDLGRSPMPIGARRAYPRHKEYDACLEIIEGCGFSLIDEGTRA